MPGGAQATQRSDCRASQARDRFADIDGFGTYTRLFRHKRLKIQYAIQYTYAVAESRESHELWVHLLNAGRT